MDTRDELFLSENAVQQLLTLTRPRKNFDTTGYGGRKPVMWATTKAYRYATPGSRLAIRPELLIEIDEASVNVIEATELVDASFATPFVSRNYNQVPVFADFPVIVLQFTVPLGYRLWLSAYALNLFPDQSNELNYFWQIRVNGQDILNKGNNNPQPGRPVQSPAAVTIGRDKKSMILVQPGNAVEVTVAAIADLGASDSVSATLFGYLEGVGQ